MTTPTSPGPERFLFLLLPRFTLLAFASSVEALRLTNRVLKDEVYQWRLVTDTGEAALTSAGFTLSVDVGLAQPRRGDKIMV